NGDQDFVDAGSSFQEIATSSPLNPTVLIWSAVASAARHRFRFAGSCQPKRRRRFALPAHSKLRPVTLNLMAQTSRATMPTQLAARMCSSYMQFVYAIRITHLAERAKQ